MEVSKEFARAISKDPNLLTTLQKRIEKEEFFSTYNIDKATPLKCPHCSSYLNTGGSLYIHKEDPNTFTCRKCKLTFTLISHEKPLDLLINNLRLINKESPEAKMDWHDILE